MIDLKKIPPPLRKAGLEKKLAAVCENNDVALLALFGSYVQGKKKKKSDVDIAIEYTQGKRKTLFDLVHLEYELRKLFKRKVDLGILSSLSPYIIDEVKKEMRVVYERDLCKSPL